MLPSQPTEPTKMSNPYPPRNDQAVSVAEAFASNARICSADFEEYGNGQQLALLYGALARAQGAFEPVKRTKHVTIRTNGGGSYDFDYAPIAEIRRATVPALAANGLALLQPITRLKLKAPLSDKVAVCELAMKSVHAEVAKSALDLLPKLASPQSQEVAQILTILAHEGGGRIVARIVHDPPATAKDYGGATTYLARYAMQRMLGIEGDEDLDDMPEVARGETGAEQRQRSASAPKGATPRPVAAQPPTQPAGPTMGELNELIGEQIRRLGIPRPAINGLSQQYGGARPGQLDIAGAQRLLKALREAQVASELLSPPQEAAAS